MTYSSTQATKYGGVYKTIYAIQAPIITNVLLSFMARKSIPSLMENNAGLYATFEQEAAAPGEVFPQQIYAAQQTYGPGLIHLAEATSYNPLFRH